LKPSQETLGDFIRRIRKAKHMSCADVSKHSARFGKRISGSYINRIENHSDLRITTDRLKAIADGLDVPIAELFARSVGLIQSDEDAAEVRLMARFRNLPPERKADILQLLELWH
jgi:transcriptional regulator with XRE-family HTH domain